MASAHAVATPGGFNLLVNLLTAYDVWASLTTAQKAALRAWPTKPSARLTANLAKRGLVTSEGTLTDAGMFICWAKFPERKHEFEPEGGWARSAA